MTSSDPNTEELMRLAQRGDDSAVQQLLVRHRDRLRRMVVFRMDDRLKSRIDASDVIQETLITATQKLPEYLAERSLAFYPWLRQIAWERLLDLHRRHLHAESRSVAREASWPISNQSAVALARQLVAGGTSPSRNFRRNELRNQVREALDQIPPADRELLLLRHLEKLRVTEIASMLDITESAAKSRLRRALERLHSELGNDFAENL